jgi:hypothetical protein
MLVTQILVPTTSSRTAPPFAAPPGRSPTLASVVNDEILRILNTPKSCVVALALVVTVNGLLFLAHDYPLTGNNAKASSATTTTEPEAPETSSAGATPTANSEGDDSPKLEEEAGAKETVAGAAANRDSKNASGSVASELASREAEPQPPPSGLGPSAPPVLNQQDYYPPQSPQRTQPSRLLSRRRSTPTPSMTLTSLSDRSNEAETKARQRTLRSRGPKKA